MLSIVVRTLGETRCLCRSRLAWFGDVLAVGYSVAVKRGRRRRRGCLAYESGDFIRVMTSVIKTRHTGEAAFLFGSSPSLSHPLPRIMSDQSDPQQPSTQIAGNPMGQAMPLNPAQAAAPVPDTSPQALGLEDDGDKSLETSTSGLRRVVEKTVDRLGRTRSLSNKSPSKRIFSLGRNKGKEPGPSGAIQIPLPRSS